MVRYERGSMKETGIMSSEYQQDGGAAQDVECGNIRPWRVKQIVQAFSESSGNSDGCFHPSRPS